MIAKDELQATKPGEFTDYLKKVTTTKPVLKSRVSKQAWLFPAESKDEIFSQVQARYK